MDTSDPRLGGTRPSQLSTARALAMTFQGEEAVLFKNVFPATPSAKVELASSYLQSKYGALLADYRPYESPFPLILISPASDQRITSTFGGLKSSHAVPLLEMHPEDARARGLEDGATVKIWNDLGEIHLPLEITEDVRPGVVCTLKGAWFRTSDNGQTVSALCPGHHADISGGACYNDTRVEVAAYPG
jgi:anaerobic selenocysteine-containing dehydrogenase